MALTAADKEFIAQAIAQALVAAAPVASAPVKAKVAQPTHVGPSGKLDGREHPCTADGGCGRLLRSPKSAASHDPASEHWHAAAKA